LKIFHHRVNNSSDLKNIPHTDGVEIDLREFSGKIVLQHDAFCGGETLDAWLKKWRGQFIIFNIKEDGIEDAVLRYIDKFEVKDYFFLDQSIPAIHKLLAKNNRNIATRVSDVESVNTALAIDSNWVWLDSFSGNWTYLQKDLAKLKLSGKKTCLVSPELVRINNKFELIELRNQVFSKEIIVDAVCTKFKDFWLNNENL